MAQYVNNEELDLFAIYVKLAAEEKKKMNVVQTLATSFICSERNHEGCLFFHIVLICFFI